ncbi:hypothetical protein MKX08_006826 [Trichoderma sp. CBMAI-0020]|nr:hypothetical protein MKX08_006826 [Trichoderma sp. CBMAI-0020]
MAQTGVAGVLLGPLTTTWTMPQTCSVFMPSCETCSDAYNGQSCNPTHGGQVHDNTACWPPATSGVASPAWPFVGWGFYSPGLACPAGYTSACTAVYGQRPPWPTQFSLVESETAIGCCPTGFACANVNNGNSCTAQVSRSTTISTAYCSDTNLVNVGVATIPTLATATTTETNSATTEVESSTFTRITTLYAPMIQLNFQASDLSTSTTASSTASPTASSPASETGTGNGTSSKSSGGLSNGAKVGLGVGLGLGVALLLAFGAFIYYYRRSRNNAVALRSELPSNQPSVEVPPTPTIKQSPGQLYEMGEYHAPVELPGNLMGGSYQDNPSPDAHRRYA